MNWARHLYKEAQDSGVTTSTDLHDWDGENEYHKDFAYQSDLVFLSTAALGDGHEEVMRRIFEKGPAKVVVATAGALGGFFMVRNNRAVRRFFPVDLGRPILDSNGAGDCFVAGYLSGYFQGNRPRRADRGRPHRGCRTRCTRRLPPAGERSGKANLICSPPTKLCG